MRSHNVRRAVFWSKKNYALFIAASIATVILYLVATMDLGVRKVVETKTIEGKVVKIGLSDGTKFTNPRQYIYVSATGYELPIMVKVPKGNIGVKNRVVLLNCKVFDTGTEKCHFGSYLEKP